MSIFKQPLIQNPPQNLKRKEDNNIDDGVNNDNDDYGNFGDSGGDNFGGFGDGDGGE